MEDDDALVINIQQSFLNLLKNYLPKDLIETVKKNKSLKILSIGCGRLREAKCLFEYFSDCESFMRLYGIDLDSEMLGLAKNDPEIIKRKKSVYLKHANASEKENYAQWLKDGVFDLIILRHPEITFNTDPFIKIFSLCPGLLAKHGYLFITTHFENEKESIKLLLKLIKLNLLLEAEKKNAASFQKGQEQLFSDKFALVASI